MEEIKALIEQNKELEKENEELFQNITQYIKKTNKRILIFCIIDFAIMALGSVLLFTN